MNHMSANELRTIISTTLVINGMSHDALKQMVFDLLASNPKLITKTVNGVKAAEAAAEAAKTFKVVLIKPGINKINFIKLARSLHCMGLAEAKDWSEGTTNQPSGKPFGVMGSGLSEAAANQLMERCSKECNDGSAFKVIWDDYPYTAVTYPRFAGYGGN
jgi:ribosomal protein L7/L12